MHETLLRQLNSRSRKVREAAIRQALALPPEELLQLADTEARAFERRKKRLERLLPGAALILLAFFVVSRIRSGKGFDFDFWVMRCIQIPSILFLAYQPTRARCNLATILAQSTDLRLVGPALTLLADSALKDKTKNSLLVMLGRLLPQMNIEQATSLTEKQRHALLVPLESPYNDINMTLAILKTLEQIGDEKAIPVVESVANRFVMIPRELPVYEAAQACLPYLRLRAEQTKQAQTLLRASDASTVTTPDVLLRPAMATSSEIPSEQLLRAAPQTDSAPNPTVILNHETSECLLIHKP
jgi:hypothetical protein